MRRSTPARSPRRALLTLVVALLVTLLPPAIAWAQPSKSIAVYIEGNNARAVRSSVLEIVPKTLTVVDPGEFSKALGKAGARGPFGNLIAVPKQRDKLLAKVRKAAVTAGAAVVVMGRVRKSKRGGDEVYIVYVDADSNDLAVDEAVALKTGEQTAALKGVLGPPLEQLAPPEKAPEEAVVEPTTADKEGADEADSDETSDFKAHDIATALFVVGVNYELGARRFDYSDPLEGSTNLRPYTVFGAPMVMVTGEIYPAATTGIRVLKDVGVTVMFAHAFGLQSAPEGGEPIGTSYDRFGIGLRARLRLGGEGAPVVGLSGGFGILNFEYDDPEDQTLVGALPDVSYKYMRVGVDGRAPLGSVFNLFAGFDYLGPLEAGEVYERFTAPSVGGIGARFGMAFTLDAGFEIRLMGEYTRMFYAFEPVAQPRDAYVAGGALDQYLGISAGVAYIF